MSATIETPVYTTTIDQYVGTHAATGLRETRLKEIRTSFSDYADGQKWDALTADEQQWWQETLEQVHAATVELAECDPAVRDAVGSRSFDGDLEDYAAWLRGEIASAKASE